MKHLRKHARFGHLSGQYTDGPRNQRAWFENGDCLVLNSAHHGEILVYVNYLCGDDEEGAIYQVSTAVQRRSFPAHEKDLRFSKSMEETQTLIAREKEITFAD